MMALNASGMCGASTLSEEQLQVGLDIYLIIFFGELTYPHRAPMDPNRLYCHYIDSVYEITK